MTITFNAGFTLPKLNPKSLLGAAKTEITKGLDLAARTFLPIPYALVKQARTINELKGHITGEEAVLYGLTAVTLAASYWWGSGGGQEWTAHHFALNNTTAMHPAIVAPESTHKFFSP
jgi:hypothetical protein